MPNWLRKQRRIQERGKKTVGEADKSDLPSHEGEKGFSTTLKFAGVLPLFFALLASRKLGYVRLHKDTETAGGEHGASSIHLTLALFSFASI